MKPCPECRAPARDGSRYCSVACVEMAWRREGVSGLPPPSYEKALELLHDAHVELLMLRRDVCETRRLLVAYIDNVGHQEGVDFLDCAYDGGPLSPADAEKIRAILSEATTPQ